MAQRDVAELEMTLMDGSDSSSVATEAERLSSRRRLSPCNKLIVAFSAIYGTVFFVIMLNVLGLYGHGIMPLFPMQRENVSWVFVWLLQTVFD